MRQKAPASRPSEAGVFFSRMLMKATDLSQGQPQGAERALQILTRSWESIVHAKSEEQLLREVCQTLVEIGGYRFVWVGSVEDGGSTAMRPVAWAGEDVGGMAMGDRTLPGAWRNAREGQAMGADAIQTGRFCIVPDAPAVTCCARGENEALPRGDASTMSVPLSAGSRVFGALLVHAADSRAFGEAEVNLLTRLAEDLSYGLVSLCGHFEHARADEDRIRLGQAVEQAAEAIVMTDMMGRILYVNPAFERVTGFAKAEIIGKTPSVLKSGKHNAEFYRNMWGTILRGEVWRGRLLNRRKDGTLYEEDGSISPVKDAAGRIINFVSVRRDVSRERQLEQQLHQSQKMEAVGRLAGGIAHDFNNLVMVINGYGDMLLGLAKEGSLRRYGEEIKRAGERAALLTRQLLAFSRQQILTPQLLDLNATVASTEKILHRLIGEDIELETRLGTDLGCIRADPGQIGQVIMNLAVNARDAMPQGGRLMIETASVQMDPGRISPSGPVPAGKYVMLAMSDTGCGMSLETQARMFEPFFTTKEASKGTGLGLATAYGIVSQTGGIIDCTSELGNGASFRVYFPRVDAPADAASRGESSATGTCGSETILLVEDEEAVRRLVREGLRSLGYRVLEASQGEEALSVASRHSGPIHVLLTDVVMPEMSGPELARRLSTLRADMKIMFMSGYNEEATTRHGILDASTPCLLKPFSLQALASRIRAMLDGSPPGLATQTERAA